MKFEIGSFYYIRVLDHHSWKGRIADRPPERHLDVIGVLARMDKDYLTLLTIWDECEHGDVRDDEANEGTDILRKTIVKAKRLR